MHKFHPILNHDPVWVGHENYPRWECRKCHCWDGSIMANNPCGDVNGATVSRTAAVANGEHIWEFWHKGVMFRTAKAHTR